LFFDEKYFCAEIKLADARKTLSHWVAKSLMLSSWKEFDISFSRKDPVVFVVTRASVAGF